MSSKFDHWIWMASAKEESEPKLYYFRKEFRVDETVDSAFVQISADSRYKLWMNGTLVSVGPCKGDCNIWFYEEVDLKDHIRMGNNIVAVEVLRYPAVHGMGNHSVFRTEHPGLFVQGEICFGDGRRISLNADESWRGIWEKGCRFYAEDDVFAPLWIFEQRNPTCELAGWKTASYEDTGWETAVLAVGPGNLQKRPIPLLYLKDSIFAERTDIPPFSKKKIVIDAGCEQTAYVQFILCKGKGAKMDILYSESYVKNGKKVRKGDFSDCKLEGFRDSYRAIGCGTMEYPEVYEPFWFRTFRLMELTITTEDEPFLLLGVKGQKTGYPLEVKTKVSTSDERMEKIWEISERSLKCCMHETYEDCPFYEQLQYVMDSRSEILYTYAVSADDRLARKCMDDFRRSQRHDGQLNCSYPNFETNIIPGFSVYYILMLYDHMMYFGDQKLLISHMPTVERILQFFHKHINDKGYLEQLGGLNGAGPNWSFIDWTRDWKETTGVPSAIKYGPITMESLLYVYGLQHAACIAEFLGRPDQKQEYREEAKNVQAAIQKFCMGKRGVLSDGPGVELYSQHVQVFAALTDTIPQDAARENLKKTLHNPEEYTPCSVAMAFYLFRSLEKTGLYEETKDCWNLWDDMVKRGATTCIEDSVTERSDCHAWGALALYEIPAVVLGVRPNEPGFQSIRISPNTGYLEWAKGDVVTPKGMVHVEWNRSTGEFSYEVPEGVAVHVLSE